MEGLVVKVKERSLLFDNIKTVLIILVVLGHALEEISLEHEYGIIRACIYSFHMPAFIFISGYFSLGGGKQKTVKKLLLVVVYLFSYLIPFMSYGLKKHFS